MWTTKKRWKKIIISYLADLTCPPLDISQNTPISTSIKPYIYKIDETFVLYYYSVNKPVNANLDLYARSWSQLLVTKVTQITQASNSKKLETGKKKNGKKKRKHKN